MTLISLIYLFPTSYLSVFPIFASLVVISNSSFQNLSSRVLVLYLRGSLLLPDLFFISLSNLTLIGSNPKKYVVFIII